MPAATGSARTPLDQFLRVCKKSLGGREVRWLRSSIFGEFVKKMQEVGRFGSNPDSEELCLKMKGGREVRSFVCSYLQILESARKNRRR